MLFNSLHYVAIFLPLVILIFHLLTHTEKFTLAKGWLLVASFYFYACFQLHFLYFLLVSICINFCIAKYMHRCKGKKRKLCLQVGLIANIGLLAYFKYTNFFLQIFYALLSRHWTFIDIILPLGISFYTFSQIAFLVDSYEGLVKNTKFIDYALFISFFPKLISGPITHVKELIPQLVATNNLKFNYTNLVNALILFSIGFTKKTVLADNLTVWADAGFDHIQYFNFFQAWITSLSFTFKVYFDFSGYTDMALASALFFNIKLPINFDSPFKTRSIISFWQHWHMSLTRFLTTYVFSAIVRAFGKVTFPIFIFATLATMLISGLWHGASYMFILFGFIHGIALVINHIWRKFKLPINSFIAWLLTFNLVNIANIFFRAPDLTSAWMILKGMLNIRHIVLPPYLTTKFTAISYFSGISSGEILPTTGNGVHVIIILAVVLIICTTMKNSMQLINIVRSSLIINILFIVGLFYAISFFGVLDHYSYVYFKF